MSLLIFLVLWNMFIFHLSFQLICFSTHILGIIGFSIIGLSMCDKFSYIMELTLRRNAKIIFQTMCDYSSPLSLKPLINGSLNMLKVNVYCRRISLCLISIFVDKNFLQSSLVFDVHKFIFISLPYLYCHSLS